MIKTEKVQKYVKVALPELRQVHLNAVACDGIAGRSAYFRQFDPAASANHCTEKKNPISFNLALRGHAAEVLK